MCTARLPDVENAMPPVSQTYGFSPECVRMCTARLPDVENALSYVSQTCDRSPECVSMCVARSPECENALPHVSQTCARSLECVSIQTCSQEPRASAAPVYGLGVWVDRPPWREAGPPNHHDDKWIRTSRLSINNFLSRVVGRGRTKVRRPSMVHPG